MKRIPFIALFILVLGLWGFSSVPPGESAYQTMKEGVIAQGVTAHESVTGTYSMFLPLVLNPPPDTPKTIFGMQMYGTLSGGAPKLPLAPEAHVYWLRWPVSWASIESTDTTPDHYNFSAADASILAATKMGLHPIVTIWNNPKWAATYANGPIDKVDIGKFAEFMAAMAERYDGDGVGDAPGSPVVSYGKARKTHHLQRWNIRA